MLNSAQNPDVNLTLPVARSPSLQHLPILTELSIEQSNVMPIFTEATALAIRLTNAPVAILTTISASGCQIASIAGLEQFSLLPTKPNLRLELAGLEYCHTRVISEESSLIITNCQKHPHLAQSSLHRVHGIQSYLGLPIVTAAKDRLGTIAI
jgi:GAF domain-containing protein